MENDIPKIHSYLDYNKCKEHTNIYIDRTLPCPYPSCKEGIKSYEFIDKGFPINNNGKIEYPHEQTYIRKSWNDLEGNIRYIWVNKNKPFGYNIHNIIYDEIYRILGNRKYETIYHYTKIDTLYKILESNELRLTEWKCTNDRDEIKHGLQLANKFNKDQLDLEHVINKNNYFITSFSYEINKKTLFADYADKGKGVAIGFDVNLNYIPRKENFWYKNAEFMYLMPIIYDLKTQEKILEYSFYIYEQVKQWIYDSGDYYLKNKLITKEEFVMGLKESFLGNIEEIISFFKHDCFEDEREVRWLYKFDNDFIKEHIFDIQIREFNDKRYYTSKDAHYMGYDSYYDIDDTSYNIKLPIKSIILGSRVEDKEQVLNKIKKQCKKHGFDDVEIKVSDLPYQ
jgi:hypothetical protein